MASSAGRKVSPPTVQALEGIMDMGIACQKHTNTDPMLHLGKDFEICSNYDRCMLKPVQNNKTKWINTLRNS